MLEERDQKLAEFYGRRFAETKEVPLRSWYDLETQRAIAEFGEKCGAGRRGGHGPESKDGPES